jgi:hypothetical protein
MIRLFVSGLFILLIVSCSSFPGRTTGSGSLNLYVSPSGSDTNAGTKSSPFKTIQKASEVAAPGAIIHVAPGTYSGMLRTKASGTAAARIHYVSEKSWGAKIIPPSGTTGDLLWVNSGDYVDIEGFEIDGSSNSYFRCGLNNGGGYVRIYGNHVHHITGTSPSAIKGGGGAGIDSYGSSYKDERPNEIFNNLVHDIGDPDHKFRPKPLSLIHGIYLANPNGKIYNNITFHNEGWGIHLWHNPQKALVANNLSFGNLRGGIVLGTADSSIVMNNIFLENNGTGIIEMSAGNVTYINNIVYKNETDWKTVNPHASDISADPKFVNYKPDGTGDYHLAKGSPAIDAGVSAGAPAIDYDGAARPKGKEMDIGPYEFGSGVTGPIRPGKFVK